MSTPGAKLVQKKTKEMPVLFLSHAAPVLLMKETEGILGRKNDAHFHSKIANWYREIPKKMNLIGKNKPTAIVQFSAHYDTKSGPVRVLAQNTYKGLLYDYYGFPEHTYNIKYPAPGSVKLAQKIVQMLVGAGIQAQLDTTRGIDHGGFIPLSLMYPDADIPVLQISIGDDAERQRRVGEVLAPLRRVSFGQDGNNFDPNGQDGNNFDPNGQDGNNFDPNDQDEDITSRILWVGSGQATHGAFMPNESDIKGQEDFVKAFTGMMYPEDWSSESGQERYINGVLQKNNLEEKSNKKEDNEKKENEKSTEKEDNEKKEKNETNESVIGPLSSSEIYQQRAATVDNWFKIPGARYAHPHYDHYMPIPACVGLTKGSHDPRMHIIGDHWLVGIHSLRSFVWGQYPYRGEEDEADGL